VNGASLRIGLIARVLGAGGALGIMLFGLLLAQDALNHAPFAFLQLSGLTLSLLAATYGGFLDRTRAAWFGWVSYGALLPSAIVVLGIGMPSLRSRSGALLTTDWLPFFIALLVLAASFPATIIARRRARSRLALVQSNQRWRGS
jgi:hypothetical protein